MVNAIGKSILEELLTKGKIFKKRLSGRKKNFFFSKRRLDTSRWLVTNSSEWSKDELNQCSLLPEFFRELLKPIASPSKEKMIKVGKIIYLPKFCNETKLNHKNRVLVSYTFIVIRKSSKFM